MDAVVPNGAAPRHHDQATFATAERREATRLPAPNRERRIMAVIATEALAVDGTRADIETYASRRSVMSRSTSLRLRPP